MWTKVWWHVCKENQWLEMWYDEKSTLHCAYCKLCRKWADIPHLTSKGCKISVAQRQPKISYGALLAAILLAAEKKRASGSCPDDGSRPDETCYFTASPLPPPPPPEVDRSFGYDQRCKEPSTISELGTKCATPGCTYLAGGVWSSNGGRSPDYCCERCKEAHNAVGWVSRDPKIGQPWNQTHGPYCTGRPDRATEAAQFEQATQSAMHRQWG